MSTKELVLDYLMHESFGTAVSGEFLAENFHISRTAVWKAVNALRNDGIQIVGTPNGGYLLCDTDMLSEQIFKKEICSLRPDFSVEKIHFFTQIDSTNSYAKELLSKKNPLELNGTIILAESQTAGRGRLGRTFYSPEKNGIYLSIIYSPKEGISNPAKITAFSAVAVTRTLKKLYGVEVGIKWVNDIFAGGKKICGILTEGITNFETGRIDAAVIGIGINMKASSELPPEVIGIAGDIESFSKNTDITRSYLATNVALAVMDIFDEDYSSVMAEYKKSSILIGKQVTVHPIIGDDKSTYPATVIDIDENAALIVRLEDGCIKHLSSGEVTLHSDLQKADVLREDH